MPFTPLHMGPGLFLKGLFQSAFSLMVFGWTQIVMDLQPLFVLLTGEGHLHGFSHTFVGGTLIAIFAALSGKYLGEFGLHLLGEDFKAKIRWWVAFLSAFLGSYSHVVLDGIMHDDVEPYFPVSPENPFLGWLSILQLHILCFCSGVAGLFMYIAGARYFQHKNVRRQQWL